MNTTGRNQHEWGVIAQIHKPGYREFAHCPLCNKFKESREDVLFGVREFNKICKKNRVYEPDSDVRLLSWSPYKTDKPQCKRTIYDPKDNSKVKTITVDHHDYAWSGSMPCTGVYRCIHCGHVKES